MTLKPMAAGAHALCRADFNWNVLRPCDMITCGCVTATEAYEDISNLPRGTRAPPARP